MPNEITITPGAVYIENEEGMVYELRSVSVVVLMLFDIPECQAESIVSYFQQMQQASAPVPAEYETKYCLLYGGTVLEAFDTLDAMNYGKSKYLYLSVTEYRPPVLS